MPAQGSRVIFKANRLKQGEQYDTYDMIAWQIEFAIELAERRGMADLINMEKSLTESFACSVHPGGVMGLWQNI